MTWQSVFIWLIIAAIVGIVFFLFYRKGKIKLSTYITLPLLAFYLSFVSTITVIARIPTLKAKYELVVFWSYKAIQNGRADLKEEIFWNIVLFIPIGILVSLLFSKRKAFIAFILSFFMSCCIEIVQLLMHRGLFEFDDIIHNSLGAVIGIIVCLSVRLIAGKALSEKFKK